MGRLAVIVVALALCTPRPAAAEERSTPRSTEWYGLEILGYALAPAGVHIAHGNWWRGGLSVWIAPVVSASADHVLLGVGGTL